MLPLATILLDPPTTFMAGAIIALLSTKLIRKSGAVEVWRSATLGAAWAVVYGLAVGWMYFIRTDWMYVYLMDTTNVPLVPTYLAFFVIMLAFGAVPSASGVLIIVAGMLAGFAFSPVAAFLCLPV